MQPSPFKWHKEAHPAAPRKADGTAVTRGLRAIEPAVPRSEFAGVEAHLPLLPPKHTSLGF